MTKKTRRLASVLAASTARAALVAGAVLAAAPASAAGYYSPYAARDYSQAKTWTSNGTQGRSYAQHGSRTASSAWTLSNSWAFADAGNSNSYSAAVYFRVHGGIRVAGSRRKGEGHDETAAGSGHDSHAAPVRRDDRGDDREPETLRADSSGCCNTTISWRVV
ncbi:hypothetical protein ATY41_11395 [Leifsonia xyli subsp. xyli]|uniref:Lactococcin 972 family bacteriocin n=1 Tax=Leifsonia xyli subsp. xyli TaxID=59736 RepID=A0A1E2SKD2_LEIXY|nr:hypothetical protein [Leifsonia xyli]ODA90150.1 hypothetical protein ATY41_11395 [Leifsonia xyli subsp. xyli]